jgi:hypothetical protein
MSKMSDNAQQQWELVAVIRDKDVEESMRDICVQIARKGDVFSISVGSRKFNRYENVEKFIPFVTVTRPKDKKIERRKVADYLAKLLEEAEAQVETLSTSNNVVSLPQRKRSRSDAKNS